MSDPPRSTVRFSKFEQDWDTAFSIKRALSVFTLIVVKPSEHQWSGKNRSDRIADPLASDGWG